MARKAWDYFVSEMKRQPIEMFYSRDHLDGQRWVAYYGHGHSYGRMPYSYSEITTHDLEQYYIERDIQCQEGM